MKKISDNPMGGGGDSRGKVIVGSVCWYGPQTLNYTILWKFDTTKIYQRVQRFLDNFAIYEFMGSISHAVNF